MKYRIYVNMKHKKTTDTYEEAIKMLQNCKIDGRYIIIKHNEKLQMDECIDIGDLPYKYIEDKNILELKKDILDLYEIKEGVENKMACKKGGKKK